MLALEVLLTISLILPMSWLGFKYYRDFYSCGEKLNLFKQAFPLLIFVAYLVFVFIVGIEETVILFEDFGIKGHEWGWWTFFLPSISFCLVIFPYQVSEMFGDYLQVSQFGGKEYTRFLGVMLSIVIIIRHIVVVT
ncbi:hypothetical protein [Pseudoalteromonas sp. S3431]|uniref:hypothetical protein n=1 Tax=Pseudoalteromonas sp. S3431 TaxID=579537 RepID=UPI0012FC396F|nr:hypothetical protein [Pseudoalteromonas sp. S3431]